MQWTRRIAVAIVLMSSNAYGAGSDAVFEECRGLLLKSQKLGMLYNFDWKPPSAPKVVVGPTFFTVPIDVKEKFIETVNCFLMGGDRASFINFDVLDWQTGKAVGRFSYGHFKMN
jgi:hypothetical protein